MTKEDICSFFLWADRCTRQAFFQDSLKQASERKHEGQGRQWGQFEKCHVRLCFTALLITTVRHKKESNMAGEGRVVPEVT